MPKDIIFGVNNITSASRFRTKTPCENFQRKRALESVWKIDLDNLWFVGVNSDKRFITDKYEGKCVVILKKAKPISLRDFHPLSSQ
jgi:hypothetical protein